MDFLRYEMGKKCEEIKDITGGNFKRLTGVMKATFKKVVEVVIRYEEYRKRVLGIPLKLSYEDQVLIMLEYLREYRTYYHIAADYGISESNCYKIVKKVEDILIKSK